MRRLLQLTVAALVALVATCIGVPPAFAQQQTFTTIAFHDVVDSPGDLEDDGVTSDRLLSFFDWLRGNGWTAVSLDDIARARRGEKALPAKAVLLTFDDGYRSLYTRAYPLALAYGYPIVAALVTSWMEAPAGSEIGYGNRQLGRERFITWDQAREMQRSGLVEFALHSHALHRDVLGNPQGNTLPVAVTRAFLPGTGYQSEAAYAAFLRADLTTGRAALQRELGRAPRTLVWPYGRYNATGTQVAQGLGFEFALTLDTGASSLRDPMRLARYLPTYNPPLADLVRNLRPDPNDKRVDRLVCLDPAALWAGDENDSNERLGQVLERVRVLGVTGLVVDAVRRDAQGRITAAWFPTRELPVAGDWLSRLAWQMHTRAGVKVYARLAHRAALAALGNETRVRHLYEDLGAMVPLDGWLLEDTPLPAQPVDFEDAPPPLFAHRADLPLNWSAWVVRARREAMLMAPGRTGDADALGWRAFAALDAARPGLELVWLSPTTGAVKPHPLADVSLVPASLGDPLAGDRNASIDNPLLARWFTGPAPPDASLLARTATDFSRHGGVSLGWCPDDPLADQPAAAVLAPGVSGADFPLRR